MSKFSAAFKPYFDEEMKSCTSRVSDCATILLSLTYALYKLPLF